MDDRLAISVTHANGDITRWGPDEPDPTDIPGDLTFSTSIPGGFKDMTCSLLRRIDIDYPDQALFDTVRVYAPGNRTVWEGRMQQFPRSHGTGFSIVPGAVGWSSHLDDFSAFREIYVGRDSSAWSDFPLDAQLARSASSISMGDFSWSSDKGGLSVALPNQALGAQTLSEAWFVLPAGLVIAKVDYAGSKTSFPAGYLIRLLASDTTSNTTPDVYSLTLDGSLHTATLTTARQNVALQVYSNANSGTPSAGAIVTLTAVAIGNHGLTLHSTVTGEPDGIYASDVIEDIVTRAAPLLSIGEIDATTFAIPHLMFLEPTKASDAISTVNAYHLYDWGVYDNKTFFFRQPDPTTLTWQARLSAGAQLDFEGDTADQVFNGVLVSYTDPTGIQKTAGPPAANWPGSTALCDDTDASLVDTSTANPATAHSITRWGQLNIGFTTTSAGAIAIGAAWLAEQALATRRGTLNVTGTITHPTEGDVPVWRVRAGDYVSIADHPADDPRKIIETNYTHSSRTLTATLDNTSHKLDAIMERIGVQLVGVL